MTRTTNVSCGLDLSSADAMVTGESLSGASAAALAAAVRIARDDGARLHLVAALDLDGSARSMVEAESAAGRRTVADHARARLEALAAGPRDAGVVTTTAVSLDGPAAALLDDAAAESRDLIVVGTRERGEVARNLLGSTALTLLRRSPVDVCIARKSRPGAPVLAAIDVGDMAAQIVATAARLAAAHGVALHVVHVVDFKAGDVLRAGAADEAFIREYRTRRRARAEAEVPALVAAAAAGSGVTPVVHLPDGDVADVIVATAEDLGAGTVVLSSVVHGAVGALVTGLGRTSESVLPRLPATLVVLKPRPAR